jgi:chromosome partitioning protein
MRSIAVVNLKGGSGKTTTALCLAVGLAKHGLRTLLVDADSQGNASMTMLDGATAEPPTLGNVLLGQGGIEEAIRTTRVEGLEILPADSRLADAALLLVDQLGREHRLRIALERIEDSYDVVVVDCPPQMSLVTVNVLAAVGELIVPCDAGIYSVAGLGKLQETVADVRAYLGNSRLRIAGLLLTRAHNNRATKDIADQLRDAFGPLVFKTSIPHSVKVEEAHARNLSVVEFARLSPPGRAYANLLAEVLEHGHEQQGNPGTSFNADPADAA